MKYLTNERLDFIKTTVNLYLNVSRYEAAEVLIKTALSEYGADYRLYFLEALIFHRQGMFVEALEKYDKVIELNPMSEDAYFNKMMILCDLGSYDKGKEVFEILDGLYQSENILNEKQCSYHRKLAQSFAMYNIEEKAIEEYSIALNLTQDSCIKKDIRMELISFYIKIKRYEKAKNELVDLIEKNPSFIEGRKLLALTFLKMNYSDLAVLQWKAILEINPEDKISKTYLQIFQV